MITIPKKGLNEIRYTEKIAKNTDYVIIVNDDLSTNVGDLFSLWNQKCKVVICNDISDYYDFIKKEKKLNSNTNILIIGTKNIKYEEILDYRNLTEFYFLYLDRMKEINQSLIKTNKAFIKKDDNNIAKKSIEDLANMNFGGKNIRGFLISLGYNIASKKEDNYYLPLAVAYETFETSILVHDDIIDKADIRRGKKTIHNRNKIEYNKIQSNKDNFEEDKESTATAVALCAGDIGFFLSNNIIVENYSKDDNLAKLLKLYNDILIYTGKGEVIDVVLPFLEKHNSSFTSKEKDIMEIYRLKTAWYTLIGPLALGLTLGGANKNTIRSIERIAEPLGIAFQIKDDILGIFANSNKIGKSCSDIEEYKQTILYSYAINTEYKEELLKYYGKNNLSANDILKVQNIFKNSGAYDYSTKKMEDLFDESKKKIKLTKSIPQNYKNILYGFIIYLELREK